jgi:hypothetical protein
MSMKGKVGGEVDLESVEAEGAVKWELDFCFATVLFYHLSKKFRWIKKD